MKVVIRADASSRVGSGHVMRCKTLADELRRRGAEVQFVCRDDPGHLIALLTSEGYRVAVLPAADAAESADADATTSVLGGFAPDWLVVDHYGLGEEWESRLRAHVSRIFVIDDLANRPHACDALLDPNWFGATTPHRYDSLVPRSCRRLLGPRYALLHPLFAQLRRILPPRDGLIRRVLVFFGAVDSWNQTTAVLEALRAPAFAGLAVDVVVGHANVHGAAIEAMVRDLAGGALHRKLPTLAGVMARADVMAGAGGATTWERCCLGLPAVVAATAANQEPFTAAVAAAGVQHSLGDASTLTAAEWAAALRDFQRSPERVRACAVAARAMTDGLGVQRVAMALWPAPIRPRLRRADRDDGRFSDEVEAADALWLTAEDQYGAPLGTVCAVPHAQGDTIVDINVDAALVDDGVRAALLRQTVGMVRPGFLRSIRHGRLRGDGEGCRSLRLTVLTDRTSWLNDHLEPLFSDWFMQGHAVRWVHDPADLLTGDVCFLLGCSMVLTADQIRRNRHTLVVHESDLPRGRGWSPLTWQILEGAKRIAVTLFEVTLATDAGPIYLQTWITLDGTELVDELRARQAEATVRLGRDWIERYPSIAREAVPQSGEPTTYRRRTPADSEIDPNRPLRDQFALLRVVDNERYPAFFRLGGARYVISIRKEKAAG